MLTMPRDIPTDRLLLRACSPDDAEAQVKAVDSSLAELGQWMAWATGPQNIDDARARLAASEKAFEEGESFAYVIWLDGEFAGRIDIHEVDARIPKGEIGYWVTSSFAGRGIAQEATRALVEAGLAAGFRRIGLTCDAENHASENVARKCGFAFEGRLVNDDVCAADPSVLRDTLVFAITC